MATKSTTPIPPDMHTLTTHLWFNNNGLEAVEFYQQAFNAELVGEAITGEDGKSLMHAMLKIGDSHVMLADAWPDSCEVGVTEQSTAGLWMYVDNCDEQFNQAKNAGCEVVMEMMDAFWGDRMGKLKDPFGHCWAIATHQWDLTDEEKNTKREQWLQSNK